MEQVDTVDDDQTSVIETDYVLALIMNTKHRIYGDLNFVIECLLFMAWIMNK